MMRTPAMRSRVRTIAIMAGAVVLLSVGISAVAIAAIGDSGTFKLCVKASSVRAIGSGASCATGETTVPVYTKGGADTRFLTKTGTAANANKLDGFDSSSFVRGHCGGYPHNGINWHGCDLHGANLDHASLSGADLTAADLVGALFRNANLVNAHLHNANLQFAQLDDGDLEGTDLSGANLTNASLLGAVTSDLTDFSGVTWGNTTCPDGTNSDNNGDTCVGHLG